MPRRKQPLTWLDNFENGHFSTELLSLELTTPDGVCSGQGFLDWSRRRGARVRAITDGANTLSQWDGTVRGLGKLVRSNQYSTLKARTLEGIDANIERLYGNSIKTCTGKTELIWDIRQRQISSPISFGTLDPDANDPLTEILLTNSEQMLWPRHHPTSLTFQSRWGTVVAWKRDRLARAQIQHVGKCDLASFLRGLIAAFSFWSSSVVSAVALEHRSEANLLRRIYAPAESNRQIAPPMGFSTFLELNTAQEALLAKALDFFADAPEEYAKLALTFLGSQRNTFSKNALVACSCLERLAKLIAEKQGSPPDRISIEQIQRVKEFLAANSYSEELRRRFSGFMGTINDWNGANAINEWCKTGFLGFTQDDARAFRELRNPSAHGSLDLFGDDDGSKQEAIERRDRVHNMLNKLFMHAMGYCGQYFDYGSWSIADFP